MPADQVHTLRAPGAAHAAEAALPWQRVYDVVTATAEQVFIPLTVGGGVRSADDVARLLACGADKVSVNSAAIARPALPAVRW